MVKRGDFMPVIIRLTCNIENVTHQEETRESLRNIEGLNLLRSMPEDNRNLIIIEIESTNEFSRRDFNEVERILMEFGAEIINHTIMEDGRNERINSYRY